MAHCGPDRATSPCALRITLDIYAHEFDHARGLDDVRDSIDAAFGPTGI